MCITKKAPNKELAYKYINFILEAKNGAQLSNYIAFATPNKASLPMIDKKLLENPSVYPDAETQKKLEFILDAGANTAMYGELLENDQDALNDSLSSRSPGSFRSPGTF